MSAMASFGSRSSRADKTLRASDADRERVVAALRDHFGAGRLSDDELDDRISSAYRAKTLADLDGLMLDLPSPGSALPARTAARRVPAKRSRTGGGHALAASVRIHATVYVLVNVMLIAIWAASGGGYFWPIWPLLGWGIGLGVHAAPLVAGIGRSSSPGPGRALPGGHAAAEPEPTAVEEVAEAVTSDRPSLQPEAAPDGTVTILFSDIEGSTALNERRARGRSRTASAST